MGNRKGSRNRGRGSVKSLPVRGVGRTLTLMATNPLIALRVALPGQPSTRELAKAVGCSHELLRRFELGVAMLGAGYFTKYAKAVKATPEDVERRWLYVALDEVHRRRTEIQDRLRELGVADPRRRAGRKSA